MDYIDRFIEKVSHEPLDIYIFGIGHTSEYVNKLFQDNHINFAGYLVDSKYLPTRTEDREKNGKPILTPEQLCSDVAVVIGVTATCNDLKVYEEGHIKRIYRTDIAGAYILNKANVMDEAFLSQHHNEIFWLFDRLSDFESKSQLMWFVTQKFTGCYKKDHSHFPAYFDEEIFIPSENETFVDCGAYNGDTVMGFVAFLKRNNISSYRKCIAFEPDPANYEVMKDNLLCYSNIETYLLGAYSHEDILRFNVGAGENSSVSGSGTVEIRVNSIDNIMAGQEVTYIKMDIEGSELEALRGAKETIIKYHPKLAICIYHKSEDLYTIPQYILSLDSSYKLYLRNYDAMGVDTVLYAI